MSKQICPECNADLEQEEAKNGKCGICGHKINVPKVRRDAPPRLEKVDTPAGSCPIEPESHLPQDIGKWCDAMIEHGISKQQKMYTTRALKYFLGGFFDGQQLAWARDNVDAWDACDLDAADFNLQATDDGDLFSEQNYQDDKGEQDTDLCDEDDVYICTSPYCMNSEWYSQDEFDEEPNCSECGEELELAQESPSYEMRSDDSLSRYDSDYDAYHSHQPYVRSDGVKIYGRHGSGSNYRSEPVRKRTRTDVQERYRNRSEEDEAVLQREAEDDREIIGVITTEDVIKEWSP